MFLLQSVRFRCVLCAGKLFPPASRMPGPPKRFHRIQITLCPKRFLRNLALHHSLGLRHRGARDPSVRRIGNHHDSFRRRIRPRSFLQPLLKKRQRIIQSHRRSRFLGILRYRLQRVNPCGFPLQLRPISRKRARFFSLHPESSEFFFRARSCRPLQPGGNFFRHIHAAPQQVPARIARDTHVNPLAVAIQKLKLIVRCRLKQPSANFPWLFRRWYCRCAFNPRPTWLPSKFFLESIQQIQLEPPIRR
jgi:hypothetical protein